MQAHCRAWGGYCATCCVRAEIRLHTRMRSRGSGDGCCPVRGEVRHICGDRCDHGFGCRLAVMRKAALFLGVFAVVLLAAGAGSSAQRLDYAAVALNVLPPGQSGDLRFPPTASDQLPLYDGLAPRTSLTARDVTRYFKPERFGVAGKVVRVERPRAGLRILRDRWDVP